MRGPGGICIGSMALLALFTGVSLAGAAPSGARIAAATDVTDVTQFQADAGHDGNATTALAGSLTKAWSVSLPYAAGYPLESGGRIFVESGDAVSAFSAQTGAPLWGPLYMSKTVEGIALDGGRLFMEDQDGTLQAVDPADGAVLWTSVPATDYAFYDPPTAAHGVVYLSGGGVGGHIHAISETDGHPLWTTDNDTAGGDTAVSLDGNSVVLDEACDIGYGYDAGSGADTWFHKGPCDGGGGITAPAVGGKAYFDNGNAQGILDDTTGVTLAPLPPTSFVPVISGGVVFTLSAGQVTATRVSDGTTLWTSTAKDYTGDPLAVDGRLAVRTAAGSVVLLAQSTGAVTWTSPGTLTAPDAGFGTVPEDMAAANGLLLVPAGNTLVAFATAAGTPAGAAAPPGLAAPVAASGSAIDWTNYLGNATHTSDQPAMGVGSSLAVSWQDHAAGNGVLAQPLIVGDTVVTARVAGTYDAGTVHSYLEAQSILTGKVLWQSPAYDAFPYVGSIAELDGVVAAEDDQAVVAFSMATGKQLWLTQDPDGNFADPLQAGGGFVYSGQFAYNLSTGAVAFHGGGGQDVVQGSTVFGSDGTRYDSGSLTWAAGGGSDPVILENGDVLGHTASSGGYAADATTGSVVDSVASDLEEAVDGTTIIATHGDTVQAEQQGSHRVNWTRTLGDRVELTPTIVGGHVFVVSGPSTLSELNLSDGAVTWSTTLASPVYPTGDEYVPPLYAPAAADGVIAVGDTTGLTVFRSVGPATGTGGGSASPSPSASPSVASPKPSASPTFSAPSPSGSSASTASPAPSTVRPSMAPTTPAATPPATPSAVPPTTPAPEPSPVASMTPAAVSPSAGVSTAEQAPVLVPPAPPSPAPGLRAASPRLGLTVGRARLLRGSTVAQVTVTDGNRRMAGITVVALLQGRTVAHARTDRFGHWELPIRWASAQHITVRTGDGAARRSLVLAPVRPRLRSVPHTE